MNQSIIEECQNMKQTTYEHAHTHEQENSEQVKSRRKVSVCGMGDSCRNEESCYLADSYDLEESRNNYEVYGFN